jgi:hypothetical protein
MAGVPSQLLTLPTAKTAGKIASKTDVKSVGANVNAGEVKSAQSAGQEGKAESFMDLLSGMFGSEESKTANTMSLENKADKIEKSVEQKVDVLLKQKSGEGQAVVLNSTTNPESVISSETLKNLDQLLNKEAVVIDGQVVSSDNSKLEGQVAATGSNLDHLLQSLKSKQTESQTESNLNKNPNSPELNNTKSASPLDFLLNKGQETKLQKPEVGIKNAETKGSELSSLLGLSSEEFVGQLKVGDGKNVKTQSDEAQLLNNKLGNEELNAFAQKNMNQNMKAYGQKQNLLNDHLIKSPKDLLTKENKSINSIDELKTPDMQIGADLSQIKESFIPVSNKAELQNQVQTETKVLDLSKMSPSNTEALIKKISDYIEQSQVGNKESIDLTVRHDSLGQFKIQVNKPIGAQSLPMDMQITTTTAEGHEFFMKNEVSLMKNLSQAGIQLSDLRIVSSADSSSFAQNDSRQQSNQSQYGQSGQKDSMNFDSGNFSEGSQRRRELWQEARANQQRYGA